MNAVISETPDAAAKRLSASALRQGYLPGALHAYRASDGTPIYYRIRCERPYGSKWIRPMRFCGAGYEIGEPRFPSGKPLYALDRLAAAAADAIVFVAEGEKCADAMHAIGLVAVTSGSSSSDAMADWTPLEGRTCVIWPDHDLPGSDYANRVADHLRALGCKVSLIDCSVVQALPKGGDVVDWLELHPDATCASVLGLPKALPFELPLTQAEQDDLPRLPAPKVSDQMYYGLVGEAMRAASNGTEVHPAAAGLAFMCFAGAALGRACSIPIGDDGHHPRLFTVHVGRSSIAGKGMALTLVRRVREEIERESEFPEFVSGNFHDGGLSSREGLAWLIRDASDEVGKDGVTVDPGVPDKRLFVVEEEFANVLRQSQRDGNTLSAAIRTAWDGHDLAPATKTNRTRASRPHIGIHACITPSELMSALSDRELTNGFANRFLYCWAERQGVVPYPSPTSKNVVRQLAAGLVEAVHYAQEDRTIHATGGARKRFAKFYRDHRRGFGFSSTVRTLLERHPPYAWRLALIFALLDKSAEIDEAHMDAALAWLAYCTDSAKLIFSTAHEEAEASAASAIATRIANALREAPEGCLERESLRVTLGKPEKKAFDAALEQLDLAGAVEEINVPREGGGWPTRKYKLKHTLRHERLARLGSATDFALGDISPRLEATRSVDNAAANESPQIASIRVCDSTEA